MKVVTDNKEILDATVTVGKFENLYGLIFESRGGRRNTIATRNIDYALALEIVLNRLKKYNTKFIKVYLVSNSSYLVGIEDRILKVDNSSEIDLTKYDAGSLRLKLSNSMKANKVDPGTKGGNPTKRILIQSNLNEGEWLKIISNSYPVKDETDLENIIVGFNPQNFNESIEKTLREITLRRGQLKFRSQLIKIYDGKCAMTETNVIQVLQAAHIFPYKGEGTNVVTNGILLRSDIHDLYDLSLIGIDEEYKIVVSHELDGSEYENLNGKKNYLPSDQKNWPSKESLKNKPLPYRKSILITALL